jgi:glycerol-3-phosphate dehydrogenase subunit B
MEHRYDIGVIGGGIAGASAALAAAAGGARVVLVRATPGATALAAGGWNRLPPEPVAAALEAAGLRLLPSGSPLPHPVGDLRVYAFAHESHAGAAVGEGTLVVGIAGLPGFRARALALLWGDAAGVALPHATLLLSETPAAGWAPASLAARLDHDPAPLVAALAEAVRVAGATAAVLPAVLGIARTPAIIAALADAAGVPVYEALGVPPSLPGWRLHRALDAALATVGVRVLDARAQHPAASAGRLDSLDCAARDGTVTRVHAGAWVLATGRFTGGGIAGDPDWRETTLGIPLRLAHLGASFAAAEPLATTSPDRRDDAPPLHVGVATDDGGHPVGPDGSPLFSNVFAAGAVRAGRDPGATLGDSAHDGWRAGEAAAGTIAAPAVATSLAGGPR